MAEEQEKKIPISLLIGEGSRVCPFLERVHEGLIPVQVVSVISHKALQEFRGRKTDVIGILFAKSLGIPTAYFNIVQMTDEARDVARRVGEEFDKDKFRIDYFRILASFINQRYPVKPEAVFMNGWDLVVPIEFLRHFLGPAEGIYNVINFHPSILPDNPGNETVTLSGGEVIPVLKGEESTVINQALDQKLPAIGVTMHHTQAEPDIGGLILDKIEVKISPRDNFNILRARHKRVESKFVADAIDKWARKKLNSLS